MLCLNFVLKLVVNCNCGFCCSMKYVFCVSCVGNFFIVIVRGSILLWYYWLFLFWICCVNGLMIWVWIFLNVIFVRCCICCICRILMVFMMLKLIWWIILFFFLWWWRLGFLCCCCWWLIFLLLMLVCWW